MTQPTQVNITFKPRKHFVPYLHRKNRWSAVVAHRRAGKTVACVMDLIAKAISHKGREPRFAYICPTYTQAKDIAWSYLKEYTAGIPGVAISESELSVTLPTNGARIRLYGADNYDRLRGLYLDGAVIDEAGDIDPRAYPEVIRPALSDRQGWATFIGTPKGRNDFHKIFQTSQKEQDWFSAELKASTTQLIPEAELEDARRTMTPEQYAQEYECSFNAAVIGAYYGRDMELAEHEGRITSVPHDRAADVYASWDLGIGDSTAIWVYQIIGKEWHWIRYYENSSKSLDHYVDWIKALPFAVHKHVLPHDAEARELQTGNSRVEFLEARGFNCEVLPRHNDMDRINAARVKFNRFWFDKDGIGERGLDVLRMYRADYDDKNKTLKPRPLHDWASHGCFLGDTEVLTRYGTCQIMNLPETGEVLTPCGWKQYALPRITKRNAPLVEVEFTDGYTVRCTPDHLFLAESGWKSAESLTPNTAIRSTLTKSRSISMAVSTACGQARSIYRAAVNAFIEKFGRQLSGQYQEAATSTTGTGTFLTIGSTTSNAFLPRGICPNREQSALHQTMVGSQRARETGPPNGTDRQKVGFGTKGTPSAARAGQSGSAKKSPVSIAADYTWRLLEKAAIQASSALMRARPLHIAGVKHLNDTADVWDITVPDGHCFSLKNGAVVHNSDAFGYGVMGGEESKMTVTFKEPDYAWVA